MGVKMALKRLIREQQPPRLQTKTITENGEYKPDENYDGFRKVIVDCPGDIPAVVNELNVTPTTSAQTINPETGVDGFAPVKVAAVDNTIDENITAANIVSGVTILGVAGAATVLDGETVSVTPTTSAQTITPTAPKNGITEVSVAAVTAAIDANIIAGNIKNGVEILGVVGDYTGGGTPVIDALSITPSTSAQTFTPSGGTDGYGPVSVSAVTAAIDANIVAGNIKNGVSILGVQGTYQGSGGPTMKYKLLDRVKDDSNNEIGTVVGFHYDANNTEYAVIALDAQFRLSSGQYLSDNVAITDLPQYANPSVYGAKETATFNCDKILAQATASELTSTAVSHCRSKTFTVDSVQYAGQLPTLMELLKILEFMTEVNAADTSASQYSSLVLSTSTNYWSSSQNSATYGWYVNSSGRANSSYKSSNNFVAPVLEIPNTAV